MSEESRDPELLDAVGDAIPEAPMARPPARARERGPVVAMATLGGLVILGTVLILRGPRRSDVGSPTPVAQLTESELPAASTTPLSVPTSSSDPGSRPTVKQGEAAAVPRPAPLWRVESLAHDPAVEILRGTLGKQTLAAALAHAGLARNEVRRITHAVENIRRIERATPKDAFVVARDRMKGAVIGFEVIASPTDIWQARSEDGLLPMLAKKLEPFVEKKRSASALVVTTDLAKAIAATGLHEDAIEAIEDALEGHGDTAVIKPGIRLRIVGHEEWVEGAFAHFDVDALEYIPRRGNALRLYRYERDASVDGSRKRTPHPGLYDAKGRQPFRGTFRSPLPLARVTSRFNPKRMHPVLRVVTPHNGVDFGASAGTPVYASGAGTVQSAGDSGPCGNMVQIEHSNGLTTAYCHLSRFAAGLHPGQHVEARQLVGYVGQTGRATGPHLHFAVKRGASFLDPMVLKMDGVRTLPPADREAFAKQRVELDAALEAIALPASDGAPDGDTDDDPKDEPSGEE